MLVTDCDEIEAMLTAIKNYFKPSFRLSIYMKSGNVIVLTHVIDWEVGTTHGNITRLRLSQKYKKGNWLVVDSIDLTQIEAVVRHY